MYTTPNASLEPRLSRAMFSQNSGTSQKNTNNTSTYLHKTWNYMCERKLLRKLSKSVLEVEGNLDTFTPQKLRTWVPHNHLQRWFFAFCPHPNAVSPHRFVVSERPTLLQSPSSSVSSTDVQSELKVASLSPFKSGCWFLVSSKIFVELPMNQMLSIINSSIVLEFFEDESRVGCKLSVSCGLTTGVYLSIGHFERRILPLNHYRYPTTTASSTTKRRKYHPLPLTPDWPPILLPVSQQAQQKNFRRN